MNVEKTMTTQVATCSADDTARDAAALMDAEDRGALFVVADGESRRIEGVITDRDICIALAREGDPSSSLKVRAVMSAVPHVCLATDSLSRALQLIETHGKRRLAVVDEKGHLLGAITLTDIARAAIGGGARDVTSSDVCQALVACSRHRQDPEHLRIG